MLDESCRCRKLYQCGADQYLGSIDNRRADTDSPAGGDYRVVADALACAPPVVLRFGTKGRVIALRPVHWNLNECACATQQQLGVLMGLFALFMGLSALLACIALQQLDKYQKFVLRARNWLWHDQVKQAKNRMYIRIRKDCAANPFAP